MRRIASAVVAGTLVAALAAGTSALGRAEPSGKASVDAKVVQQIAAHGHTTFWIVLRDQANLNRARSMRPAPRGRYVYDTLTTTADRTQRPLELYLAREHVPFKSFWILNAIQVKGDGALLQALAERPDVAKIIPDVVFHIPPEPRGVRERAPDTVEWPLIYSGNGGVCNKGSHSGSMYFLMAVSGLIRLLRYFSSQQQINASVNVNAST